MSTAMPTTSQPSGDLHERLAKTPAEAYERGFLDGHAQGTSALRPSTPIGEPTLADVMQALAAIQATLEQLLDALADDEGDDDEGLVRTLDGQVVSWPRDENESLG